MSIANTVEADFVAAICAANGEARWFAMCACADFCEERGEADAAAAWRWLAAERREPYCVNGSRWPYVWYAARHPVRMNVPDLSFLPNKVIDQIPGRYTWRDFDTPTTAYLAAAAAYVAARAAGWGPGRVTDCEACHGTGNKLVGLSGHANCPACHGTGTVEATR